MEIPVIIVDDETVDRMIVQKRLERSEKYHHFSDISEFEAGDAFLDAHVKNDTWCGPANPVILMDVNMPRLSGFETVDAIDVAMARSGLKDKGIVLMFTSSENPIDQAAAEQRQIVRGFITKPMDEHDIERILELYATSTANPQ